MRRREFIALVGGAAAGWPLAARAQRTALPVIGFLGSSLPDEYTVRLRAFRQGLKDEGFIEARTSSSNIAGQKIRTADFLRLRPNWFAVK